MDISFLEKVFLVGLASQMPAVIGEPILDESIANKPLVSPLLSDIVLFVLSNCLILPIWLPEY